MNTNRRSILFFVTLIAGLLYGSRGQALDIQDAPDDGLEMQLKDKQIAALSNQVVELENELLLRDLDTKRDQELFRRQIFEELAQVKSDIQEVKSEQTSESQKRQTDHTCDVSLIEDLRNQLNTTQEVFRIFKKEVSQQIAEFKSVSAHRKSDTSDAQEVKPANNQTMDASRVEQKQSTISTEPLETDAEDDEHITSRDFIQGSNDFLRTYGNDGPEQYAALKRVLSEMETLNHNIATSSGLVTVGNFSARAACTKQLMNNSYGNLQCTDCLWALYFQFMKKFPNSAGGRMRSGGKCKMRIERYPFDKFEF